jgi:hypothetical protein
MGSRDAAEALAEGQCAAGSVTPEWGPATPQKEANGFSRWEPVVGFSRSRSGWPILQPNSRLAGFELSSKLLFGEL